MTKDEQLRKLLEECQRNAELNNCTILDMLEFHIVDHPTAENISQQRKYIAALKSLSQPSPAANVQACMVDYQIGQVLVWDGDKLHPFYQCPKQLIEHFTEYLKWKNMITESGFPSSPACDKLSRTQKTAVAIADAAIINQNGSGVAFLDNPEGCAKAAIAAMHPTPPTKMGNTRRKTHVWRR